MALNIADKYGKLQLPRRRTPLTNTLTHTSTHTSVLNCILITILLLMLLLSPPTYFRLRCPSLSHPRPRGIYNRTYLSICIHITKYVCPYVSRPMHVCVCVWLCDLVYMQVQNLKVTRFWRIFHPRPLTSAHPLPHDRQLGRGRRASGARSKPPNQSPSSLKTPNSNPNPNYRRTLCYTYTWPFSISSKLANSYFPVQIYKVKRKLLWQLGLNILEVKSIESKVKIQDTNLRDWSHVSKRTLPHFF